METDFVPLSFREMLFPSKPPEKIHEPSFEDKVGADGEDWLEEEDRRIFHLLVRQS